MALWRHFCAVSADSAGVVVTGFYPSDFLIATGKPTIFSAFSVAADSCSHRLAGVAPRPALSHRHVQYSLLCGVQRAIGCDFCLPAGGPAQHTHRGAPGLSSDLLPARHRARRGDGRPIKTGGALSSREAGLKSD